MKNLFSLLLGASLLCAVPAFANVTVTSPVIGTEVVSPFQLLASAPNCSSQYVVSMGYSIDNSTNTTIIQGSSINAHVASISGAHTVHVKAWNRSGEVCVSSIPIIVVLDPATLVPTDALVYKGVQALSTWQGTQDSSVLTGTASGKTSIVATPSLSHSAREFATKFTNSSDERYWVTFGDNTAVSNFLYDGWIYVAKPSNTIANIELDMNQVMANGQTVIYGFQCDGYSGTWDYTANEGTPLAFSDQWLHSALPCNPRNWSTNVWHHVQITYSRDSEGTVTYQSVWLDGVEQDLNVTVRSAFALGWGPVLLTNFQVDGHGSSGSPMVYLDNLTISGW
jgi:hypothetical protein